MVYNIGIRNLLTLVLSISLLLGCETTQLKEDNISENKERKLSPMEKLAELSKAAVGLRIYSIIQADPSSLSGQPTYLPDAKASIMNIETRDIYTSHIAIDNLNIFLDVPPGDYVIYDLSYDDPMSYIVANWFFKKLDDRTVVVTDAKKKIGKKDPLIVSVEARRLQYGGDFSIAFSKDGTRQAPPDYENEERDMKKIAEMILAKFPHSRWAKDALIVLGIDNNF